MKDFQINSLSFYNYGGSAEKMNGSISLTHKGTSAKMELALNAEDCSRILNIVADRIADTAHRAAHAFWVEIGSPTRPFLPPPETEAEGAVSEETKQPSETTTDDDIPF